MSSVHQEQRTAGDKSCPCGADYSGKWTDRKHTIPLHDVENKDRCTHMFGHYKKLFNNHIVTLNRFLKISPIVNSSNCILV